MAQSLAGIVIHIVFSTKERKPWIDAVNEPELHAYTPSTSNLEF